MIKAFAITMLIAIMGSSISEFSLSPHDEFRLHFQHDYVFSIEECGAQCITLTVSQMTDGIPTWTGQLFDLQEKKSYPLQMEFEDVQFESVYVVSIDAVSVLRISYREPVVTQSQERLVKASSEKETMRTASWVIILELSAVVFLVFLAAYRILHKDKSRSPEEEGEFTGSPHLPRPVLGFHDEWQPGIPRCEEEDSDLELLQRIRELENLKEMEMQRRMRRRQEEAENMGLDWI
ncbi:MAG: hypothetical protein HXS52_01585 [Theionarchaea archaeon]|nr:hypothetical protein [Theionarchaea archaeon]MBU7036595.1 hypothetical protein [Theionarchaea archaeon]